MILIFEGPDGAGKTTLIDALTKALHKLGKEYWFAHHGAYLHETNIYQHYLTSMLPAYEHKITILDRSWIAEPIYGKVMRNSENRVLPWQRRMLERVALGRDAMVIRCLPGVERCLETFRSRREREYPQEEEQLRQIYYEYALNFNNIGTPSVSYDYTVDSLERTVDTLLSCLFVPGVVRNEGPGIGTWYPRRSVMLVGEKNSVRELPFEHPFVTSTASGCSAWLATQLEDADIPERDLYWINAFDSVTGNATDYHFISELEPKRIIALGESAYDWVVDAVSKVKYPWAKVDRVFHPQYWKRFRPLEPYELISKLKERHTW